MAIPSGEIFLLKNVPLSASYEHTIDFKDKNEQYNYFTGFIKDSLSNYTYTRTDREYITLGLPLQYLDDINYLMFRSATGERLYYAFVIGKRYVGPSTTDLIYSIDVMQTYQFDYEWRASYIKQAHVDRWTAEHKPIYSKTDEGLFYGTEYSVESAYRIEQESDVRWFLVNIKQYRAAIDEEADGSLVIDSSHLYPAENSFTCLLLPFSKNSDPTEELLVTATINGEKTQICDYNLFSQKMQKSALGEYIQSIVMLPYCPYVSNVAISGGGNIIDVTLDGGAFGKATFEGFDKPCVILTTGLPTGDILATAEWDIGLTDSLPTAEEWAQIKAKPRTTPRDKRWESKLLCSPYRYNLLTDWRSAPVVIKNEYLPDTDLTIKYSFALTYLAPFRYWVKDYKRDPEGRNTCLSQPMALEMPVISDAYYSYMLQNKNTIQANLTNAIIGAATSAAGAAMNRNPLGVVSAALDVQAHIRNENAKQADLKTIPDTIINANDSIFNIIDNNDAITWYRMRICCENEEIISNIFNMSGYTVNRVEIPNTRSRTRFNYIQTVGANIVGSFAQSDLLMIKEIYNKGITIWHYSEKDFNMYDYSYENIEVNLV